MIALALIQGTQAPMRMTNIVCAYANWSPDGRTIVYQSNAAGNYDLYTMNVDGANVRLLYASRADDITPVFSPDGNRIAFVSEQDGNREVYICDRSGGKLINITNNAANDLHPSWSRDGRRIMFSSNRGNQSQDDYDIYVMDADGKNLKQLTSGPDVDTYASWSPDETKIVTRRVVNGNNEVFLLDANGKNGKNLTNAPEYDGWPVWSPDGKWIAFASGPDTGIHKIYMLRPDGSERREVTKPVQPGAFVYNTQPCFSPDGTRLIYTDYRLGSFAEDADLCIVAVPK